MAAKFSSVICKVLLMVVTMVALLFSSGLADDGPGYEYCFLKCIDECNQTCGGVRRRRGDRRERQPASGRRRQDWRRELDQRRRGKAARRQPTGDQRRRERGREGQGRGGQRLRLSGTAPGGRHNFRKVGSGSGSVSTAQPVRIDSEVAVPSVQPITDANESPVQIQITAVEVVPEAEN
uniref:Uncharacterized protein n=1 Tax=Oryza meridionalis TaxID=40149 RepID=A0A0E0F823_9ORYZ